MKTKHQNNTKSHTLLFISHYSLVHYEPSCGHKIEEVTPKQTRNEHGRRKNKTKQTNREESRQKEAGVKVACKRYIILAKYRETSQATVPGHFTQLLAIVLG